MVLCVWPTLVRSQKDESYSHGVEPFSARESGLGVSVVANLVQCSFVSLFREPTTPSVRTSSALRLCFTPLGLHWWGDEG